MDRAFPHPLKAAVRIIMAGYLRMTFRLHKHSIGRPRRAFTLVEVSLSVVLIAVLLSLLLPLLSAARVGSYREQCAANQRILGQAWQSYLNEHGRQFPWVQVQPAWFYGGVRFSAVDTAVPDYQRPLTAYLPLRTHGHSREHLVCSCPADRGITSSVEGAGTGKRTAFRSYGTSYRANAPLMDARLAGINTPENRGMNRDEITTAPSRLVMMGDPVWYEAAEDTGRNADWHGEPNAGNLLFLDGSVRFMTVRSRKSVGPIVFDPIMPTPEAPTTSSAAEQSPAVKLVP